MRNVLVGLRGLAFQLAITALYAVVVLIAWNILSKHFGFQGVSYAVAFALVLAADLIVDFTRKIRR